MRSDDCVDRLFLLQMVDGETSDLFIEQLHHSSPDHRPALQMPLAGRIVFSVDQATLEDQGVLWDLEECSEDPDLDRYLCVRARRHYQEAVEFGYQSLHYSANPECDSL